MPSSLPSLIEPVLATLDVIQPRSILDIGIGRGKYGLLAREYLPDLERVDGVEIWPPYVCEVQNAIYDKIYQGDAVTIVNGVMAVKYDVYMLIDVIEHMLKPEGMALLRRLKGHKIVSTPDGPMPQGPVFGNPYEAHISSWTNADFVKFDVRRRWNIRGILLYHLGP